MATKKATTAAKKTATAPKAPAKRAAAPKAPAKKTPAKKASAKKAVASAKKAPPAHEEIALRAHQYWVERGYTHGSHHDDWLRAERELS